ncbi:hypothetical protein AAFF_G00386900, partial [Aldrovandia affinis]
QTPHHIHCLTDPSHRWLIAGRMRLVFLQQRDSNMVHALTCFTIASLWLTGLAVSDKVHQFPSELMKGSGGSMMLNCSHTIPSYNTLLWYHRAAGDSALTLIGYVL